MKPWDDNDAICDMDDDEIDALWEAVQPGEFYFTLKDDSVIITPASFFDTYGCCYDQHMPIERLLPRGMHCEMEGQWSKIPGPIGQTETELLVRGFVQNQKFTDFIAKTT